MIFEKYKLLQQKIFDATINASPMASQINEKLKTNNEKRMWHLIINYRTHTIVHKKNKYQHYSLFTFHYSLFYI